MSEAPYCYSPLWLVLWEKLGKPPKELALGVVARDTRSSSEGSSVRDEPEKVNAERWNAKKTEGCDGCLSVYFTRPLITGSGWVLWYDGFTAAPRAGWDSLPAPPSTLVLHGSWFISPPLNLTEDLTDKMLVHVNKNYIVGFVFEHSFQWYNFR